MKNNDSKFENNNLVLTGLFLLCIGGGTFLFNNSILYVAGLLLLWLGMGCIATFIILKFS